MATLLTELGFPTGHEQAFSCRGRVELAEQVQVGESSCAAPAWDLSEYRVLHLTRSYLGFTEGMLGRYFWADTCPCHEPGAHLQSPYAQFFDRHVNGGILAESSEVNRIQAHHQLWNEKIRYAKTRAKREVPVEYLWTSRLYALNVVRWLTGSRIDPHQFERVFDDVGVVNSHPSGLHRF